MSRCNEQKKVQRAEIMENITIIWLFISRIVTSLHINVPEKISLLFGFLYPELLQVYISMFLTSKETVIQIQNNTLNITLVFPET